MALSFYLGNRKRRAKDDRGQTRFIGDKSNEAVTVEVGAFLPFCLSAFLPFCLSAFLPSTALLLHWEQFGLTIGEAETGHLEDSRSSNSGGPFAALQAG